TSADNGRALDAAPIAVHGRTSAPEIVTGVRIGITKAIELPWRYGLKGSRYLSKPFTPTLPSPARGGGIKGGGHGAA
ncbi:MAG: hypothetical protein WBA29_16325, partial [Xanthobacteraceae bacterium]